MFFNFNVLIGLSCLLPAHEKATERQTAIGKRRSGWLLRCGAPLVTFRMCPIPPGPGPLAGSARDYLTVARPLMSCSEKKYARQDGALHRNKQVDK